MLLVMRCARFRETWCQNGAVYVRGELEDCKAECQGLRQFQAEKACNHGEAGSVTEAVSEQRLQRVNEQLAAARKEAEAPPDL
eukprot:Skav211982  [mRNA]  locus=scaffold2069:9946:10698:+ [translate_table: standard]